MTSVDPFSWIILSRRPINLEITCPRDAKGPPNRVHLYHNLHLKFQSTHRVITTFSNDSIQDLQQAVDNIVHRLILVEALSTNLTKFVHGSNLLAMVWPLQFAGLRALQVLGADKVPRPDGRCRQVDQHDNLPLALSTTL